LATLFTEAEYTTVSTNNEQYVEQNVTNTYATFLFKNQNPAQTEFTLLWNGQSSISPKVRAVYLQVWNVDGNTWDTLDEENNVDENIDFDLTATVDTDLDHYFNADGWIACRIYQRKV
jgi:hypothetical protein